MSMNKTMRARILKSAERARDRGYSEDAIPGVVSKNLSVPIAKVREALEAAGVPAASSGSGEAPPRRSPKSGRRKRLGAVKVEELIDNERLDSFRIAFEALSNDLEDDDTINDEQLRQHCGISKEDWKELREDDRLSKWRARIRRSRKIIWCGPKAKRKLEQLDTVILD